MVGAAQQRTFAQIVHETLRIEVRQWETAPVAEIVAELVPELTALACQAMQALDALIEALEQPVVHDSDTDTPSRWSSLCDIAFMARWDLRRRLSGFGARPADGDPWSLLAECSSLRRRIVKSLCEVERTRSRILQRGFPFEGVYRSDLSIAIATRRAYRSFIRGVRSVAVRVEAGELTLLRALRLSATEIAVLIGRDIYEELRIEDRQQLRSLQGRIFASAVVPQTFPKQRVWSDVVAFAELLAQVQRRPELLAHDYELVCEVLARVRALRRGESLEQAWLTRLATLEGRDARLDACLAGGQDEPHPWFAILSALAEELGRALGRSDHAADLADHDLADHLADHLADKDDVVVARPCSDSAAQQA